MTELLVDKTVIAKSVTKEDVQFNTGGVGIFNYFLPYNSAVIFKILPDLPAYGTPQRDYILSSTVLSESRWSIAVKKAIAKHASAAWEVTGEQPLKVKRAQEMLHSSNGGRGWTRFMKQHLRDYLCTDNGAFIEVVRATGASGSQILGLVHLDSRRCRRTGDPEIPVIYRDRLGREHWLKSYQVLELSDMTDSSDTYFGMGLCAASRAYNAIRRLATIEQFILEKVSGARPLSLHFFSGVAQKQLQQAIETQEAGRAARGMAAYGGAALVGLVQPDKIDHISVDFASLPNNFDLMLERKDASLQYANALDLDPQVLDPGILPSGLGAGAQAQVMDDKDSGGSMADWREDITFLLNEFVLPDSVSWYFHEKTDYRDQKAKADVFAAYAGAVSTLAGGQPVASGEQAMQKLVDEDLMPKEFLQKDLTPGLELDDNEKADVVMAEIAQPTTPALPLPQLPGETL